MVCVLVLLLMCAPELCVSVCAVFFGLCMMQLNYDVSRQVRHDRTLYLYLVSNGSDLCLPNLSWSLEAPSHGT
jgi:hypothetical protein